MGVPADLQEWRKDRGMTHPTEKRLRDWIDGLIASYPYKGSHFLVNLALTARDAGAEEFVSMLPLLRHHFALHPEYSYEDLKNDIIAAKAGQ